MSEQVWTVGELLSWAPGWLARRGSDSARLDAELLLADALGCERLDLYLHFDRPCERQELSAFKARIARRGRGEPVAYILGRKGFHAIDLEVGPGVLVPRPETEWLIDHVLRHFEGTGPPGTVVDVGTGSGAIALALARAWRDFEPAPDLLAIDLSDEALRCATANADRLGLSDRVRFARGRTLEPARAAGPVAAIVSNPPYVLSDRIPNLAVDVRDHEPWMALDGGPDGMSVLREIARDAPSLLRPGGLLAVEVGSPEQGRAFAALLAEAGLPGAVFRAAGPGPTGFVSAARARELRLGATG